MRIVSRRRQRKPCELTEAPKLTATDHPQQQFHYDSSRHFISTPEPYGEEGEYVDDAQSESTEVTIIPAPWAPAPPTHNQHIQHSVPPSSSEATARPDRRVHSVHLPVIDASTMDRHIDASGRTMHPLPPLPPLAADDNILDDLSSGPPTPDVDDTPYIRYAIDMITAHEEQLQPFPRSTPTSQHTTPLRSSDEYPVERLIPDEGLGYVETSLRRAQSAKRASKLPVLVNISPDRSMEIQRKPVPSTLLENRPYTQPDNCMWQSPTPTRFMLTRTASTSEMFIPVDPPEDNYRYPPLTFLPGRLRPFSMITIMILCLLMQIALLVCAIYSSVHNGLTNYTGGLYSAQYFLFQFVPQILAAFILLYIESVMSAVSRVVPFTMVASDDTRRRSNALFVDLYPGSLIWPRFSYFAAGEPYLGVCSILLWPMVLTIPLQSSLFAVILVDNTWRWTAVRGVVWTLIIIYILALLSLLGISIYFSRRSTGLLWDPRSIADIIALLPRSNILPSFTDTEVISTKSELRDRLETSGTGSPRLGYWRTNNAVGQEIFYCIGDEGASLAPSAAGRHRLPPARRPSRRNRHLRDIYEEKSDLQESPHPLLAGHERTGSSASILSDIDSPEARYRYTPWYLSPRFVLLWPIASSIFLVAIFIVSFIPGTTIKNGFLPQVPAAPDRAGFSAANFLYSFIPSLLGMGVYYGLRYLFLALCRLAPWAALASSSSRTEGASGSGGGATASQSLLLDFSSTAVSPVLSALSTKNYLIAALAIVSPISILVPVLAGGIFFPLQVSPLPSNTVLMLPQLPAYILLLVILIPIVASLFGIAFVLSIAKDRRKWRFPHATDCLAEVLSFLYASSLVHDVAFVGVKSKADLVTRLVGRRERGGGPEVRYSFGGFAGKGGRSHLGVERVRSGEGEKWWGSRLGRRMGPAGSVRGGGGRAFV